MLTEIEIFAIKKRNRILFFRKCWPKSRFSKFWTEIDFFSEMLTEIDILKFRKRNRHFSENFDWNRDFQTVQLKSNFFFKCWPKSRFSKLWNLVEIFSEMLRFSKFWTKSGFFSKNVDRNRDFGNFEPKSDFFQNVDQSRFWKFWTLVEIFSKRLTEIEIFEILNRKPILFENVEQNRGFWNFEP